MTKVNDQYEVKVQDVIYASQQSRKLFYSMCEAVSGQAYHQQETTPSTITNGEEVKRPWGE